MKKFSYRLEPLLRLREHEEKEKQKELALAQKKVLDQESEIQDIVDNRLSTQSEQRSYMKGRINTLLLTQYSRYYTRLKKEELKGYEILKIHKEDRQKRQNELIEATKKKKIYEKLKERRQEKYYAELKLLEQKEQDEIASMMIQHKKSSRT